MSDFRGRYDPTVLMDDDDGTAYLLRTTYMSSQNGHPKSIQQFTPASGSKFVRDSLSASRYLVWAMGPRLPISSACNVSVPCRRSGQAAYDMQLNPLFHRFNIQSPSGKHQNEVKMTEEESPLVLMAMQVLDREAGRGYAAPGGGTSSGVIRGRYAVSTQTTQQLRRCL